jgi:hypothetical protein
MKTLLAEEITVYSMGYGFYPMVKQVDPDQPGHLCSLIRINTV